MHFNVKNIKLWLKEDFHYLKNSEIWLDMCHPDIASHLKVRDISYIYCIDLFLEQVFGGSAEFRRLGYSL